MKLGEQFDIAILVNNAGLGGKGPMNRLTSEEIGDLMCVNVVHPTFLSKVFMRSFEKRSEKSCIINVSSLMELHPLPGYSLYSSSKAYINNFHRSIS